MYYKSEEEYQQAMNDQAYTEMEAANNAAEGEAQAMQDQINAIPITPSVKHPEDFCELCGSKNPDWRCDNELFNKVNGSPNGIICPACFEEKAKGLGIEIIFKATTPSPRTFRTFSEQDLADNAMKFAEWVSEKRYTDYSRGGENWHTIGSYRKYTIEEVYKIFLETGLAINKNL